WLRAELVVCSGSRTCQERAAAIKTGSQTGTPIARAEARAEKGSGAIRLYTGREGEPVKFLWIGDQFRQARDRASCGSGGNRYRRGAASSVASAPARSVAKRETSAACLAQSPDSYAEAGRRARKLHASVRCVQTARGAGGCRRHDACL